MEKQAVTSLLIKWGEGDKAALDELLPVVYEELRRMAKKKLRGESSGNSLQPTALVHEAYLKLSGLENPSFENRARFFALSATVMRNVLVDHARHHIAAKRGGGGIKVSLSQAGEPRVDPALDVLALDDALKEFSAAYPQHARIVELRYFTGLDLDETAKALEISPATVKRHWSFAKAWLRTRLDDKA